MGKRDGRIRSRKKISGWSREGNRGKGSCDWQSRGSYGKRDDA